METAMTHTEVALRNILVATDFSSTSEKALQYAAAIATRYDAKIHLLHVLQPTAVEFLQPAAIPEAYERLHAAAQEALKKEAEQLTNIVHRVHLMSGIASESVEGLVREEHIDLVIVGTHSRKGFERFVLGSTAEDIFRTATCPVLTVGPKAPDIDLVRGLDCILFPTDLASNESGALAHAISLAKRHGARLVLLYVMSGVMAPPPREQEWFEKPCLNRFRRLIPTDVQLPHPPEYRIEYFDPAPDVILRVALALPANLIVLSVRPEQGWATRLPDKAYRIVAESLCPVLSARERESA